MLHSAASRVAGLDLAFVPGKGGSDVAEMLKGDMEVVYLLGADEIDMSRLGQAFVIYQGSHGDAGAHRADVILAGAAYTEKSATYVNLEGRAQLTEKAAFAPGDAREDWTILRALSALAGHTLPYDTLGALRTAMYAAVPGLARIGMVEPASPAALEALAARTGSLGSGPFEDGVADYYLTNPIARASQVMSDLSRLKVGPGQSGSAARAAAE